METKKVRLRINEAIGRAKQKGIKVNKKIIASKIWVDSSISSQQMNMLRLCNGRTKKIAPEWIMIICEMCDCTPNYLMGYDTGKE